MSTTTASTSSSSSQHVISRDTPVYQLEVEKAFESLSESERQYSHHLSMAAFLASPTVLFQTSPESAPLFALFLHFLSARPAGSPRLPEDLEVYLSHLFTNMGNYKSFGDSKFIPAITKEDLVALLSASPVWHSKILPLWSRVHEALYSAEGRELQLGFGPDDGISTYYSTHLLKHEAEMVQRFMDSVLQLSPYNTRLFKLPAAAAGVPHFELRLASARTSPADDDAVSPLLKTYDFEGIKITVTRGDHHAFMQLAVDHLRLAKPHASNDNER